MAQNCDDMPQFNEQIIYLWQEDTIFVDSIYTEPMPKTKRILFFGGDSDPQKSIIDHKNFFDSQNIEILMGHYFFVNYEKELASIFDLIHESEEYIDLIRTSSDIITTSVQCALEARISCANVIFIAQTPLSECIRSLFETYNISIVDDFNQTMLRTYLSDKLQMETIIPINTHYNTFFSK